MSFSFYSHTLNNIVKGYLAYFEKQMVPLCTRIPNETTNVMHNITSPIPDDSLPIDFLPSPILPLDFSGLSLLSPKLLSLTP